MTARQRHDILADNVVVSDSDNDNDNVDDNAILYYFVIPSAKGVALWL